MAQTRLVCLFVAIIALGSVLFPSSARAVAVSPTTINFGSITENTASTTTLVVTNNTRYGTTLNSVLSNLPQFVVSGPALPLSLAAHASASFQVTFQPNSAASFGGSVTITMRHKGTQIATVALSGSGVASATVQTYLLSLNTGGLGFGNQAVGSTGSLPFAVTNKGTGPVSISQVTATGPGFSISGFSGAVTLASGQSLSLAINFAPTAAGSVSGGVTVVSTATNSPETFPVSGTGVQPEISVIPSSVSFGNVTVGVTNSQTLTIKNPGTATLNVTQASLSGTGFTSSGLTLPLSVPAGNSASFNLAFAAPSATSYSGSITFISNSPNSPLVVPFSGTGIAATHQLSASPASLSFGSLTTGTNASQTVILTNTGNSSVSISQVSESGTGFSARGIALPLSLAVGQSTSLTVTFAPASAGSLSGSVTVVSNTTNSPLVIALSGTGAAPVSHTVSLGWTPSSSTYSGFNIYRGTTSGGPYTRVDTSMIPSTSYVDSGVNSGQTYYYVATEVDTTGTESGYSSEVSAVVP